jgi:hypothetical protein
VLALPIPFGCNGNEYLPFVAIGFIVLTNPDEIAPVIVTAQPPRRPASANTVQWALRRAAVDVNLAGYGRTW